MPHAWRAAGHRLGIPSGELLSAAPGSTGGYPQKMLASLWMTCAWISQALEWNRIFLVRDGFGRRRAAGRLVHRFCWQACGYPFWLLANALIRWGYFPKHRVRAAAFVPFREPVSWAASSEKRFQSTANRHVGCTGNRFPGGLPIAPDGSVTRHPSSETGSPSRAAAQPSYPHFLLATMWISLGNTLQAVDPAIFFRMHCKCGSACLATAQPELSTISVGKLVDYLRIRDARP
jgi:hypothetical protein